MSNCATGQVFQSLSNPKLLKTIIIKKNTGIVKIVNKRFTSKYHYNHQTGIWSSHSNSINII